MRQPSHRLLSNPFLRSVVTLASSSGLGQALVVAAMPILTRIYAPEDFGTFAVFSSLLGVMAVVVSLRYELAIPLPMLDRNATILFWLSLTLNVVVSGTIGIVVLSFGARICEWMGVPGLVGKLWLLPLALVLAGTLKAIRYWAIRQRHYGSIAKARVSQSVGQVLGQIAIGVSLTGAVGLIWGQLIGYVTGLVSMLCASKSIPPCHWRAVVSGRSRVLLRRYKRFPQFDVAASLVDVGSVQLPNLLFAALFGPVIAGFYLVADRCLAVPMSLASQSVGQVLYGASRHAITEGTLFSLALRIVLGMALLVLVPATLMVLWAPEIFAWLFGDSWERAGDFAAILILGLAIQFLYSPISVILMATNGQHINLCIHSIILAARVMGLWWGFVLQNAMVAVAAFSLIGVIGYGTASCLILSRAKAYSCISTHNE